MKTINYCQPNGWKANSIERNSDVFDDLLQELYEYKDSPEHLRLKNRFKELYDGLHRQLESGSGAIVSSSKFLTSLNLSDFTQVVEKFFSFVGELVFIDKNKNTIKKICDEGYLDSASNPARGHLTNQALPMHCDRADITSLICFSPSSFGGEFNICSSSLLVNYLRDFDSNAFELIQLPIVHDLRGESSNGKLYTEHPILSSDEDSFVFRYIKKFILSAERHNLKISSDVIRALKSIDEILQLPEFNNYWGFHKGDIVLLNNHLTLHGRKSFVNDLKNKRYLLRGWMSSEFSRPLPATFYDVFHDVRPGAWRGGIR
jgi:Taurine catabolism dioxygenase TauD, TfdA family